MKMLNLFRKKTPVEILEKQIKEIYEEDIKAIIKKYRGSELISGVMLRYTIVTIHSTLREDDGLLFSSRLIGLTEFEYRRMLDGICKQMLDKYLQVY